MTAVREVEYKPITYTAFVYDGTQGAIDDLNTYLSQEGGLCVAQYESATSYKTKNPTFDNNFYSRDIADIHVWQKVPGQPPIWSGHFEGGAYELTFDEV